MYCSFLFLRKLLTVACLALLVTVGTFIGKAEAATTSFQNPYFIDADKNRITFDARSGEDTINGDNVSDLFLYDATSDGTPAQDCPQKSGTTCKYGAHYSPPTIRVSPDKSIDLTLVNSLPVISPPLADQMPPVEANLEYVSQDTNLHYHGFNVSPLLGSDDVVMHVHSRNTPTPVKGNNGENELLIPTAPLPVGNNNPAGGNYPGTNTFNPITNYGMKVNLPKYHQSGLFWYHPHVHTVSDPQVKGGMSGGIIVEGIEDDEYYPVLKNLTTCLPILVRGEPECIDENTPLIKTDGEKVMLFKDANPAVKDNKDPSVKDNKDPFTVNGQYNPEIKIAPGELQFWRIGNIGADKYLNLTFIDPASPGGNNHGSSLPTFYILARDGSTVTKPVPAESILVPPASRVEVLVIGGNSGDNYELVSSIKNDPVPYGDNMADKLYYNLASVGVTGDSVDYDYEKSFGNSCTSLKDCILSMSSSGDEILPDASQLAKLPYCSSTSDYTCMVKENPENPEDKFEFDFGFTRIKADSKPYTVFTMNNEVYEENRIDKTVSLGTNQEWKLVNTKAGAHAFHMHQLDFTMTEVTVPQSAVHVDKEGSYYYDNYKADCTLINNGADYNCKLSDYGYRDTINLPPNSTTIIRTPFLNPFITGIFVFHCHILRHEDRGMMKNIKVVDSDSYLSSFEEEIKLFKESLGPGPAL